MPLFPKRSRLFEGEEEKPVRMGHLPAELAQRTYIDPWAEYEPQPEPEADDPWAEYEPDPWAEYEPPSVKRLAIRAQPPEADPWAEYEPDAPSPEEDRAKLKRLLEFGEYTGKFVKSWRDTGVEEKRYNPLTGEWEMSSHVLEVISLPTSRFVHPDDREVPVTRDEETPSMAWEERRQKEEFFGDPDMFELGPTAPRAPADPLEVMAPTEEERAALKRLWELGPANGGISDRIYWNEIQRIDRHLPEYKDLKHGELAQRKVEQAEDIKARKLGLTPSKRGYLHPDEGQVTPAPPPASLGLTLAELGLNMRLLQNSKKASGLTYLDITPDDVSWSPFGEEEAYTVMATYAGLLEKPLRDVQTVLATLQDVAVPGSAEKVPRMGQWMDPERTGKAGWLYNVLRTVEETQKDVPADVINSMKDAWNAGTYDEYFADASDDPSDPNYKPGLHDLDYEIRDLKSIKERAPEQNARIAVAQAQYDELKSLQDAKLRTSSRARAITGKWEQNIEDFKAFAETREEPIVGEEGSAGVFFDNVAKDIVALGSIIPHAGGMFYHTYEWLGSPEHATDKWITAGGNVGTFGQALGYHFYSYFDSPIEDSEYSAPAGKYLREPLMVQLDFTMGIGLLGRALRTTGAMTSASASRTAMDALVPTQLRKYGRELVDEHARLVHASLNDFQMGKINGAELEAVVRSSASKTKTSVISRMEAMVEEGTLSRAELNKTMQRMKGEFDGITAFETITEAAPDSKMARALQEALEAIPDAERLMARAEDAQKASAGRMATLAEEAGDLTKLSKADAHMQNVLKAGSRADETALKYGDSALELTHQITSPKTAATFQMALDIIDPASGVRITAGMTGTEMLRILKTHAAKPTAIGGGIVSGGMLKRVSAASKAAISSVKKAEAQLAAANKVKDISAIKSAKASLRNAKKRLQATKETVAVGAGLGTPQVAAGYSLLERLLKDIGFKRMVLNGKLIGKKGPSVKQLKKAQQLADDIMGIKRSGKKYPPRVQAYMDEQAANVAFLEALQGARKDLAVLHADAAATKASIRMRTRVGVPADLPGNPQTRAKWGLRFQKAAAMVDKHGGKLGPLFGPAKSLNWLIGQALKGNRGGNALWRYWYHTQDTRLLEVVTTLRREAAGATDEFAIVLSNRLRQVQRELGDDAAKWLFLNDLYKFEREHIVSKFNRNPDAKYGQSANAMYPWGERFTLKEGIEFTPAIQRELNTANKYSDLLDYMKHVTRRGDEVGAFWGTEGLMEVYFPEVYKKLTGKIEELAKEAETAVYLAALKRNTRRDRLRKDFKEIEGREKNNAITREQAAAEKRAASEKSLDDAEQGYAKTGNRLSTDFNETLMERLPQTIKHFEDLNMYNQMQRDSAVVKAFDNIDTGTAGVPKEIWAQMDDATRQTAIKRYNDGIKSAYSDRGWIEIGPHVNAEYVKARFPDAVKGGARTPTDIQRVAGEGWWVPGKTKASPRKLVAIENPIPAHLKKQKIGKYGTLDGMLQPDVAYDMLYSQYFLGSYQGWAAKSLQFWKAGKTILSAATHATNFLSNMLVMAPAAGLSIANPTNWPILYQAAKEFALGTRGPMYVRWVKAGGKGPAGVIQRSEIARATEEGIGLHYSGVLGKSRKMWGDTKKLFQDPAMDFADATFSLSDDMARGNVGRIAKAITLKAAKMAMEFPGYFYQAGDDFWRFALFIKKTKGGMSDFAAATAGLKGFADYGALAGWANYSRVSWWGKPFIAFDASMIPQMVKFLEQGGWKTFQAKMWMHVTEQMSMHNLMAAGIDPAQIDAWLESQPPWRRRLMLLGQLHPDWAFDDEGRVRTASIMKYTPAQRIITRPEESMSKFAMRLAASENPVTTFGSYWMHNYDPFKQQQIYQDKEPEDVKTRKKAQAFGQLMQPNTPFGLGIGAFENYASKRLGQSLDRKELELKVAEHKELESRSRRSGADEKRMASLGKEIHEMQARSKARPGMAEPETPSDVTKALWTGIIGPSIGREDVKESRYQQLSMEMRALDKQVTKLVYEIGNIKHKTQYTTDYKNKRVAELKVKLAKLQAKAKRTKRALSIFDTDMIDAKWEKPPRKPSKKDIQRFIETD